MTGRRYDMLPAALAVSALLCGSTQANACAVCFGDPNSPLTKGAFWGVVAMAGVIGSMLTCIAGTSLYWIHRSRKLGTADTPED